VYKLAIINKGVILSRKELTDNECRQISGFGAQWLMNAIKKHFNLDIGDSELTIRFILSKKYEHIRVLIRNWKDNKAFSKNLDLKLFNTQNPPSVIRLIRESVYNFSGVESRDFLNQWYEKKRIELRQDKLNDLGI
jgi:hypothetical protein